ncbi:winged helix-turn-helix domain-containing protein [Methanococcus sp. CF]
MENVSVNSEDITQIKDELSKLNTRLNQFIEKSNQQHVELILNELREKYSNIFYGNTLNESKSCLENSMISDCEMKNKCFETFLNILNNSAENIKENSISEDRITNIRKNLEELKEKLPYEKCSVCYSETVELFEKQLDLMKNLGIYSENHEEDKLNVSEEEIIESMLEPISNKHRLLILKSLMAETKTFSDISKVTGLKAGNLLFHLKKLQDSEMIMQRSDRGDYMITKKGIDILNGILGIYGKVF